MLALLSTVWLTFANPEAAPETTAPERVHEPAAEPARAGPPYRLIEPTEAAPIEVTPVEPAERKRLSKAQRLLIGGAAFGLGATIQWGGT